MLRAAFRTCALEPARRRVDPRAVGFFAPAATPAGPVNEMLAAARAFVSEYVFFRVPSTSSSSPSSPAASPAASGAATATPAPAATSTTADPSLFSSFISGSFGEAWSALCQIAAAAGEKFARLFAFLRQNPGKVLAAGVGIVAAAGVAYVVVKRCVYDEATGGEQQRPGEQEEGQHDEPRVADAPPTLAAAGPNNALAASLAAAAAAQGCDADEQKARVEEAEAAVPEFMCCPILKEPFNEPVVISTGHTFERASIALWLSKTNTCPVTRRIVNDTPFVPNLAMKRAVQTFLVNYVSAPGGGAASSSTPNSTSCGYSPQQQLQQTLLYQQHPSFLCCPVSSTLLTDAVIVPATGLTFSRGALLAYLHMFDFVCPVTGVQLARNVLENVIPNRALATAVEVYRSEFE